MAGKNNPMFGKKHSKLTINKIKNSIGDRTGENNPHFKSGRHLSSYGYVLILNRDHPFKYRNYYPEHRLVIEKIIGRYLTRKEAVHHLGEKTDNRPKMLMCFKDNATHHKFHKDPLSVNSKDIIFDGRNL